MPENTDTNRSVSEVDVSGFEDLQSVQAPQISLPDTILDHQRTYIDGVKQLIPRHAYTADAWILNELRDNSTFRNRLVDSIIENQLENDNRFNIWWNRDQEDIDEIRSNYRKNLYNEVFEDVTRNVLKGESAKQSILEHHKLRTSQSPEYDITNPLSIVTSAPEDFEEWLDVKDIKNNRVSPDVVRSMYDGDEDFKEQVIRVNLRNFEKALGTKANSGVYDPTYSPAAASEYAKAYAIYTRFGSEALTDYTNIIQHYVPDGPQEQRVMQAFRRFRSSPQYRGVDIFGFAGDFIKGRNSIDFDNNDPLKPFQSHIQSAADKYDIDPALLAGLIMQESSGRVDAVGSAQEIGLTQMQPATARELGLIVNDQVDERLNPEKAIMGGAQYLRKMLDEFDGDETKALAAYNAGPGGLRTILKRAEEQGKDWTEVIEPGFYGSVGDYISKVGGHRDTYSQFVQQIDGLEFTAQEPIQRKPKDWNAFTERTFYTPENETARGSTTRTLNFINSTLDWISDGRISPIDGEFLFNEEETGTDWVKAFDNLARAKRQDGELFPESYAKLVFDIVHTSFRDEMFDDLIATLATNAHHFEENEMGEPIFTLDYRELEKPENAHLRMIVDGLNLHNYGDSIMTKAGNTVTVEPYKQLRRDRAYAQRWLFKQVPRPVIDEDSRNIVGWELHVPNNSFQNAAAGVVTGVTNILPEAWGGIVGGWGANLAEWLGAENAVEFFDNQRHKTRDFYSGTLMDFTDPVWEPFGMPFSLVDIGVAGGTLGGYLAGINFLGKGTILGAGKLANIARGGAHGTTSMFASVSAARKAQNFREIYSLARGSRSRAAMDLRNTHNAVSKNLPYSTWPKYVVGSAAIETMTDPQYSLAGLVTAAMPGSEWAASVDRTYQTSGHFTRWAMDFAAGEFLGLMFDGMIGVTKLANDMTLRSLRGKPRIGLQYDVKSGRYLPESESTYHTWGGARKYIFPEIQRFAYNIRNGVENIPVGDIKQSALDYVRLRGVGPQDFEGRAPTQADIAAKMVSDGNDFMATMREDLRAIITDASEQYGGAHKLTPDRINALTDEVYDELMDTMARQTYSLIGKDNNWNVDVFARHLEDHPGDLVDITPLGFQGRPTVNRHEAQVLSNQNPNSHVIPVGDGQYKVFDNDPALWRFDLARRIRHLAKQPDDFRGNVQRHWERFGIDVSRETDVDDAVRISETLESVEGVGVRSGDREGVISGFTSRGWEVRWDDGTETVYGSIRGLEGVPETPPNIRVRKADTPTDGQRVATGYDEKGVPIYEDVSLRGSQELSVGDRAQWTSQGVDQFESPRRVTDIQTGEDGKRFVQFEGGDTYVPFDEVSGIERTPRAEAVLDVRPMEDRVDEAIPLPGVVRLEHIAEQDRAAFEAYRAGRDMEPDDITRLQTYYRDRLVEGLRTRNDENILKDIQMLRGMGMNADEVDELIRANAIGDEALANYYSNFNRSQDFGEGVYDELLAARVDARRAELIEDEVWNNLPERVQQQMIEQADMLAATKSIDEPQRLINEGDLEVTANRSWETSNERFRDTRPPDDELSPREYAIQLAEDLGTGTVRDIAKLQKTRAGGSEKIPIRTMSHEDLVGPDGRINPIKNSKGLVVRVEPLDGGLPYYAIGRKNNIKGFPTRFVTEQNGTIIHNQEWAFINPNVTQRPDGQLKRFNPVELPNGEMVFREHAYGKYVLNVQNPVRVDKYDYLGRALKGNDGKNLVIPGKRTDEILSPDAVYKRQVDAIEIRDPGSSRVMYRVVSPESQALRHGKTTTTLGDQRSQSTLFETHNEPLNAGEVLGRMSKADEKKVYSHAWLAVPGMIATGGIGIDENGELTTAAKVGLALGAIGIGGVMIRSMRGNFKIRGAYDALEPRYQRTFDQFDWRKIAEDGTPIRSKLTDDESAMFNRLKGVPKDDYKMLRELTGETYAARLREGGFENVEGYRFNVDMEDIPTMRVDVEQFESDTFTTYSTRFNENGTIDGTGGRSATDEVISLEFKDGLDFVTTRYPGHAFSDVSAPSEGASKRPIAWARLQRAPDGRLLLDELQIEDSLQSRRYGLGGDVRRDLYSTVLDDVVERAVRESGGEFYVTRGDLQMQRAYGEPEGVRNFYDNTLPNVIRKRYGAEIVDAMGSPKDAYDSPGEAFHRVIVTEEGLRNARNKTGKRINWELIPGSIGLTGLAYAAYNMEDIGRQPFEGQEVEQAGLGVIGMVLLGGVALGMFGRGRLRTKMSGAIKGKAGKGVKNVVDQVNAKMLEVDGKRMSNRELHELNAHFNPHDESSINWWDKVIQGTKGTIRLGKEVGEWFGNSAYTQAGVQHLRSISETIKTRTGFRGSVVSDHIRDFLQDTHNAPARVQGVWDTYFNETLGYGQGAFREFPSTKGVEIINSTLGEATSNDNARVLFGDAVARLMHRGATRNQDRAIVHTEIPPHVRQIYETGNGEMLQRLDDQLLRNTEFMDYIETLHHGFREVDKEYLELLTGTMGRRLVRFRQTPDIAEANYKIGDKQFTHEDLVRIVEDWVTHRDLLAYREFAKNLDPDERQLLRIAKRDSKLFGDIHDIQTMRRRFTDLRGRYYPQMTDYEKTTFARQSYVDEATNNPDVMEGTHATTPDEYAQIKMKEDFRNLNMVGDGRGLIGMDETTMKLQVSEFDSIDDARMKLISVIREGATERVKQEWEEFFGDRTLTNQMMEDLGFVAEGRNAQGDRVYHLRQPDNMEFSENIFETANNLRFDDYYNTVMMDPAIRKSNHLENPRNFNLPMSWMVTDPVQIMRQYSWDTGTRLHALRHNVFKGDDFQRNYIAPLEEAMRNARYTDEQIDKSVGRVMDMYRTQFGIIRELAGKTPAEAQDKLNKMRRTNAAFQTYRNLDYGKRTYGFKYLNWFQLLVSTLPMTSGRALRSAMGMGDDALSQGGLKQLEGMFKDLYILKEKDMSFRFDIQPGDPTGEPGSVLTWAQKNSQRLADTVSDFSLEKSFLKLLGVDVGSQSRAVRMFTSTFHDTNVMNTAMNGWAFMGKGQDLARIARQMRLQGIQPDQVYRAADGSNYNWEQIYRELEFVGVSRHKEITVRDSDGNVRRTNHADYFIEKEAELSSWMDRIKNNELVSLKDFDGNHADIVENMWHYATETYHGTNRVMRPEKWNTPVGRTLSMYASFTFNIGMQNTKARILDPVDNWIGRYGMDAEGNQQIGRMQIPRLMKMIRNGDEDGLRAAGISNPKMAIAEFPVDAIDAMRRGFVAMGFGIGTYTTLDVMRDVYAYPVQVALGVPDEERFRRSRTLLQEGIINPYASRGNQVRLGDLFGGEADVQDMVQVLAWGIGKFGQSSYGGMYLSPFDSISKYGFRGYGSLAPSLGIGERFIADIFSWAKPYATLNWDEVPGEDAKFLMNNLPVIGSNVFGEARWAARQRINEYQRELRDE